MKNIFLTWLLARGRFSGSIVKKTKNQSGFTLLEVLVVAVMVGILSAIAAPGWVSFTNNQRTRTAQSRVSSSVREAQSIAKNQKIRYQVSFRNKDDIPQYVIHPSDIKPASTDLAGWDALAWQNLESGVKIDASDINQEVAGQIFSSRFDFNGNYIGTTDKYIRLEPLNGGTKYCVVVSTLLGAVKTFNQGEASCN